jgi:predicted nucleic acid-binding protein
MNVLVDTNILLRATEAAHPQHRLTVEALDLFWTQNHELVIVPQILYEYWVVATRPVVNNGLGLSCEEVSDWLSAFRRIYRLFRDERTIFPIWQDLVTRLSIKGKPAHDARLVAAMIRHSVTHLLTYNTSDFKRFAEVTAVSPAKVLDGTMVN